MTTQAQNSAPKLLIVSQLFYPELISTGQTLTELAEALSQHGINVHALCGPPTLTDQTTKIPKKITHNGIHITRVWSTRFPKINVIGKLINHLTFALSTFLKLLIDPNKFPILVVTNPPFLGGICALIYRLKKRPFLYLVFDVYPETAITCGLIGPKSITAILWQRLNQFVFNSAQHIIVIGRCMQNILAPQMTPNTQDKLVFIPVWADDTLIGQTNGRARNPFIEKWELTGKCVILYSGNMGRFHDLETLLESANQLKNNPDIAFVFVGEGHKKDWAVRYAATHNLPNVQFHTYVDRDQLGTLLSTADIGLVSLLKNQVGLSVPSKTFGLLSAKVPVIGVMPSESEIARILTEYDCGAVTEPGNVNALTQSILTLAHNPKRRAEMGRNGFSAIQSKYSLTHVAQRYAKLLK